MRNDFELTEIILRCCFEVSNELGMGFLESVYKNALVLALRGTCKIRLPGKIDDFEARRHGQQSWPGRSDEANLNKLAEELRGARLQKGDFNGHWIFASAS